MPADILPKNNNIKSINTNKKPAGKTNKSEKQKSARAYNPDELTFALDIGTRTVVGIVGIQEKEKFKVLAAEVFEHKERAMLDGQIHDISKVADAAKEVKEKLEKKLELKLSKVAIAAAGRTLRTSDVIVERDIEQGKEISQDLISSLEMEGIQQAQFNLESNISSDDKTQYYCVGYSVIRYYLDGYVMSSLQGHRGSKISVEILATFLPHIVVDSLYTVMNRVGLEVVSLSLEPIAAINVTIPENLRLLNLALVDIGAGTSDIAITKDGSVVAYAMVPIAGDEITEKIAQQYLVDFNTAEKIKISLNGNSDIITFNDILGKKQSVSKAAVIEIIHTSVEALAATISRKILDYNPKPPSAVFLIGGGSQVPGLTELIAEYLKLPEDRVVVRGRDIIQNIKYSGKKLTGPEAITPFGIAITALKQTGKDFLSVTINGNKIRLFNSRRLTVSDALILVGFNPRQLIGSTGKSITFELNGQKKIVRGEYGKAAEIFVNEKPANLETILSIGDDIKVIPAENGKDAEVRVGNYIREVKPIKIYYNSNIINAGTNVLVNGKEADTDKIINTGDRVDIITVKNITDLITTCEIDINNFSIFVNGIEADTAYVLKDMDKVECRMKDKKYELAESEDTSDNSINAEIPETIEVKTEEVKTIPSGNLNYSAAKSFGITVIVNGKTVTLKDDKKQYIYVDIFNYIDFDITKSQGNLILKLNGKTAGYTDNIRTGDVIDIYWDK